MKPLTVSKAVCYNGCVPCSGWPPLLPVRGGGKSGHRQFCPRAERVETKLSVRRSFMRRRTPAFALQASAGARFRSFAYAQTKSAAVVANGHHSPPKFYIGDTASVERQFCNARLNDTIDLGCKTWAGERDSATETILPIVITGTLKVFAVEEVKGEKSGPPSRAVARFGGRRPASAGCLASAGYGKSPQRSLATAGVRKTPTRCKGSPISIGQTRSTPRAIQGLDRWPSSPPFD